MSTPGTKQFNGKVALVTGAASGIGRAIAWRLAAEGARVALADIQQTPLTDAKEALGKTGAAVKAVRLDVTLEADWQTAIKTIVDAWGRLDIFVNCAGIAFAKPITELQLADWRRVMATNLDGVFLGTRQALAIMKSQATGCLINVASAAGIKPVAGNAAYGTSKAAIRFLTRVAALEAAPLGIRVNSVSPGAVATPMWETGDCWPSEIAARDGQEAALKTLVRQHGFAEPEEVAAAVVFLASDDARHITGADIVLDNGFSLR